MVKQVTIDWGETDKTPEQRKIWLGAWLVSRDGEEGEYFYDGPGGVETTHDVPAEAVGFRLRWWPPADAPANLAIGPIATLAEDYFLPEGPEQRLSVKAMSLVR
ncbi:MAG: hypothetical protein AB7P69_26340 [Candidatus Binatia bacterium]